MQRGFLVSPCSVPTPGSAWGSQTKSRFRCLNEQHGNVPSVLLSFPSRFTGKSLPNGEVLPSILPSCWLAEKSTKWMWKTCREEALRAVPAQGGEGKVADGVVASLSLSLSLL